MDLAYYSNNVRLMTKQENLQHVHMSVVVIIMWLINSLIATRNIAVAPAAGASVRAVKHDQHSVQSMKLAYI